MDHQRRKFLINASLGVGALALPRFARAAEKRTVAILFDSMIAPIWEFSIKSMRQEAAKRGWTLVEAISGMDDNKQFQQVQSMIQRKVDAILIIQTDRKAVIPAIRAANAANIPMLHYNRAPAESDAYSVAVIDDDRVIMKQVVETAAAVAKAKGQKSKAAEIIGHLGDANAVNRRDGAKDALAGLTDWIEPVAQIPSEWNPDKAFAGLTNALQAQPDINFLIVGSDFLLPSVEQAMRAADKWKKFNEDGHVIIASMDGDDGGYIRTADGYVDAMGVKDVAGEVVLAFDTFEKLWAGQKPDKVIVNKSFFVATQANIGEVRDRIWGYPMWKSKQ
jgi:ABC-type sugar transport system substrate-binding protein